MVDQKQRPFLHIWLASATENPGEPSLDIHRLQLLNTKSLIPHFLFSNLTSFKRACLLQHL